MEALFETRTIPALLTFIAIFLCFSFLKGVVEFIWSIKQERDRKNDKSVKKLQKDVRRAFTAIKILAGDGWGPIRKTIMEDDEEDDE